MTAASLDVGRAPVIIGGGLGLAGLMTAFRLTPMPAVVLAKAPLGAEASRAGPRAA
jgi:L-aspartate oxidase